MGLLARWLAPFVAILLAAYLLPDQVVVQSPTAAALFALVLAALNAFVRPILRMLAFPITCLTLGLFHFVINAILLAAAAALVPGVVINGATAALAGAVLVSVVGALVSQFVH